MLIFQYTIQRWIERCILCARGSIFQYLLPPCFDSRFGILDRCKELVEAGYDVRQPDKENVSLLHWAAINNRAEVVK